MKTQLALSVLSALGASMCCITPVLGLLGGTGSCDECGSPKKKSFLQSRTFLSVITILSLNINCFPLLLQDIFSKYCAPGSKAFITFDDARSYHKEISAKKYKYNNPGLEMAFWNAPCFEVIDPFSNKLLITEEAQK